MQTRRQTRIGRQTKSIRAEEESRRRDTNGQTKTARDKRQTDTPPKSEHPSESHEQTDKYEN